MLPNIPVQTMGGHFFWDTLREKNGWKLQRHKFTGHARILDPENVRQAWGPNPESLSRTFEKFTGGYGYEY